MLGLWLLPGLLNQPQSPALPVRVPIRAAMLAGGARCNRTWTNLQVLALKTCSSSLRLIKFAIMWLLCFTQFSVLDPASELWEGGGCYCEIKDPWVCSSPEPGTPSPRRLPLPLAHLPLLCLLMPLWTWLLAFLRFTSLAPKPVCHFFLLGFLFQPVNLVLSF